MVTDQEIESVPTTTSEKPTSGPEPASVCTAI